MEAEISNFGDTSIRSISTRPGARRSSATVINVGPRKIAPAQVVQVSSVTMSKSLTKRIRSFSNYAILKGSE